MTRARLFMQWLSEQQHRRDSVGQLAREAALPKKQRFSRAFVRTVLGGTDFPLALLRLGAVRAFHEFHAAHPPRRAAR